MYNKYVFLRVKTRRVCVVIESVYAMYYNVQEPPVYARRPGRDVIRTEKYTHTHVYTNSCPNTYFIIIIIIVF